jgi:hypothetical protein
MNLNLRETDSYLNTLFFHAFKDYDGMPISLETQMDVEEFKNLLF